VIVAVFQFWFTPRHMRHTSGMNVNYAFEVELATCVCMWMWSKKSLDK
jgi:hypothetical protein